MAKINRRKSDKEQLRDRQRRRSNIARGIRIGLYEAGQALAPLGITLEVPPLFVPYTVAVAEGGRQGATIHDKREMIAAKIVKLAHE